MGAGRSVNHKVEAGSMADIAFLLLIFFLVTTTIVADQGILTVLPPYDPNPPTITPINQNNVVNIKINSNNKILFENNPIDINQIKELIIEQVLNKEQKSNFPSSPNKVIISLQNDRGTSYETYIAVYDKIKAAYSEMWDQLSKNLHRGPYKNLSSGLQKEIRNQIPLTLSEAEPVDLGE